MKKRLQDTPAAGKAAAARTSDDWSEEDGDGSSDEQWLEPSIRERDSSRIRRQMEARRKLEQLMEARRLKHLVDDWGGNDEWSLGDEQR